MSIKSLIKNFMNVISINGKKTSVVGNNIKVRASGNNRSYVSVNGVVIEDGLTGIVEIKFEGDLANLDATHVTLNGNVSGDVDCTHLNMTGDINGDVDATHVSANNIKGKVDAIHIKMK